MHEALVMSVLAGLSTFAGTTLVLRWGDFSRRWLSFAFSFSGVVMMWIACFELIPAAASVHPSWWTLGVGLAGGVAVMSCLHRVIDSRNGGIGDPYGRLGLFFAAAIIAHNLPEGAAIGIGYGTRSDWGWTLSLAMMFHNIPEGMGLAAPLLASGRSRWQVAWISLIAGASLPMGTWLGLAVVQSPQQVAAALFFAVTSMIWVVVQEVWPQAWRLNRLSAWFGLFAGLLIAFFLHLLHGHGFGP
ncbi:ZIP family metal transporter [Desmospora profundinema]|uniref:ZIP family zinc transporter n=1 Tax=Desmospora profundinema TaxID=1571184 RepID=A0ABU1ILD1_9BACL|nr:ZIP family metal transporter [Desmospora profundinema]MDR6225501.1 ZIP family zinc transporter [Desmospora profundinema]